MFLFFLMRSYIISSMTLLVDRTTSKTLMLMGALILVIFSFGFVSSLQQSVVATSTTGTIKAVNGGAVSIEVVGNTEDQPDTVSLSPIPGGGIDTGDVTVRVLTNRKTGYTLVIRDSDKETALVSSDSSVIPAGTPVQSSSAWGYRVDGEENWNAISTSSRMIKQTSTATLDAGDVTTVTFGVSASAAQPEGIYNGGVMFTATANADAVIPDPTLSDIVYMQEMTPEICAASVEHETKQLLDKRDGKSYWVTKLKDGECWMTQNLALDIDVDANGNAVATNGRGDQVALSSKNTDVTTNIVQGMQKTETSVPVSGTLTDYEKVARSWNLGNYVYTTPTDSTPCSGVASGVDQYDSVMTGGNFTDLDCGDRYKPYSEGDDAHYSVGNYYTYSAVTAKTGDNLLGDASGDNLALGSICPKGWTLPRSGTNGNILSAKNQFYQLLYAYGYPAAESGWIATSSTTPHTPIVQSGVTRPGSAPMYFTRSGVVRINYGSLRLVGYGARYWSASAFDTSDALYLNFDATNVYPANHNSRAYGFSARCVAK